MERLVAASLSERIEVVGRDELLTAIGLLPGGPKSRDGRRLPGRSPVAPDRDSPPAGAQALLHPPPGEVWAGVDEAGRGPLAGPVVACALVLTGAPPEGVGDSKTLSPRRRERLVRGILQASADVRVAVASATIIDRLNIFRASLAAMAEAVRGLSAPFDCLWVDGPHRLALPEGPHQHAAADADRLVACVAAASVVAKVVRDRIMQELDRHFPGYALAAHKGYPTRAHLEALARLGPSPIHRRSFRLGPREAAGL